MRVALVTSAYAPSHGGLGRHVRELARGLAERGADVEVLTQRPLRGGTHVADSSGVVVRCFPCVSGPWRFAVAPGLLDRLRRIASSVDLADVHATDPRLALAVARGGFRRFVFSPHAPIQRLLAWPQGRATTTVIGSATEIVCNSSFERELLLESLPQAAPRTSVVPVAVDAAAIRAAAPFEDARDVVLAVGRLERSNRIDRAIAAMASLDPGLRLVVVGGGPLLHRLRAHAADLRLSSRVQFVGPVSDAQLYRWLRSARAVVALHDDHSSGIDVTEALAAAAPVVASDIPVHRDAAARVPVARVSFVSPRGSPFEVADAIAELAPIGPHWPVTPTLSDVSRWEDLAVERVWEIYSRLIVGRNLTSRLPRSRVA